MRSSPHGPCARTAPRRWGRTATVGRLRAAVLARSRDSLLKAKLPASRTTRCVPALRARKNIVRKRNKANFAFSSKNCLFRASTSYWGRRPFSLRRVVDSPLAMERFAIEKVQWNDEIPAQKPRYPTKSEPVRILIANRMTSPTSSPSSQARPLLWLIQTGFPSWDTSVFVPGSPRFAALFRRAKDEVNHSTPVSHLGEPRLA